MRIGLLLPHFSNEGTWERLIGYASRIEDLGFDSVWVRDNVGYRGHAFELPGNRFVDPFMTLSAVAARTEQIRLGTAVAGPFRHPLVTAQLVGSLSWISRGRFELGFAPGGMPGAFEALGLPFDARVDLWRESLEIILAFRAGGPVTHSGDRWSFSEVVIDPPPPPDLKIWYGGGTRVSARRAAELCEGILASRCPFPVWDDTMRRLDTLLAGTGREVTRATIPIVSVGRTREAAEGSLGEHLSMLRDWVTTVYKMPQSEGFDGAFLIGTPDDITEGLDQFREHGVDEVVLDARLSMGSFEEFVEVVGAEVLPPLRAAAGMSGGVNASAQAAGIRPGEGAG